MRRFWITSLSIDGDDFLITGSLFHHVCHVCRFNVGHTFVLVSQGTHQYIVELVKMGKDFAQVKILKTQLTPKRQKPFIHLALSCPRFNIVENLIKSLVELNVSDFHPFVSDFSFIRKTSSLSDHRYERWKKIVQYSLAQSLNSRQMTIHSLIDISSVLKEYKKQLKSQAFLFYEGEGKSMYSFLSSFTENSLDSIWIFIGSEGGFSEKDISLFEKQEITPLSLGKQILRVETACLAALSILKYKLQLF